MSRITQIGYMIGIAGIGSMIFIYNLAGQGKIAADVAWQTIFTIMAITVPISLFGAFYRKSREEKRTLITVLAVSIVIFFIRKALGL